MHYADLSSSERSSALAEVRAQYDALKSQGLKLDISRGKPGKWQLDLSNNLLLAAEGAYAMDGVDVRNYGSPEGLPSCRRLFGDLLGCSADEVLIGNGSASLPLMYDILSKAYTHGLYTSERPWSQEPVVRFLCPAPGYDRHFNLSLSFGMELIPVPLREDGPDMDIVEALVRDPAVKGMWCVPKYSNPDGYVYSETTLRRIAALQPAAPDFALMWDNAYCVHTVFGTDEPLTDILGLCREAGHPHMVYEFASTSKITFAGSGIAAMAMSRENRAHILSIIKFQTVGTDKVSQLLHVRFLRDRAHVLLHMEKHASFLRPRFLAVLDALDAEIAPLGIARWNRPKGGYFISFYALPGMAKRIVELCREAGVTMTAAGATYPYGVDPDDSNIRIAPSYASLEELEAALQIFCVSVKLAALEQLNA